MPACSNLKKIVAVSCLMVSFKFLIAYVAINEFIFIFSSFTPLIFKWMYFFFLVVVLD